MSVLNRCLIGIFILALIGFALQRLVSSGAFTKTASMETKASLEDLRKLLRTEDALLLQKVINDITTFKTKDAADVLIEEYEHIQPAMKLNLLRALRKMEDPRALNLALKLAKSQDPGERAGALALLASYPNSPEAKEALQTATEDSDRSVSIIAKELLKHPDLASLPQ